MIAPALREAHEHLAYVQGQVDDILANLLPGWRPRFPPDLGWRFVAPAELHVYESPDVPGALAALRFIGFESVTLHPHELRNHHACECTPRTPV